MAKFLQNTLETMSVERKGRVSLEALEFFDLFKKVRSRGGTVSTEEILVFCRLFRDEITLGSLPRPQILALCKILAVRPFGTTPYLRYQLELKLRKLKIDDMMIYGEGIDSLNPEELKVACQARGIPVSEETPDTRLREQLRQWLDLSVQWDIPPSLLILSQVLMYPSDSSPEERLAAAVQSLPEEVCTATRADLLNCCGRMDYQTECECIGEELNKVEEERAELAASSQPAEGIGEETGSALTQILCRSMRLEREKLARLKQKMTGYEEKQDENDSMTKSQDITTSREQKGAKKLKIQLNKMIDDLYKILEKLNSEQNDCQAFEGHKIALSECEEALAGMDSLSQSTKAKVLRICQKLDRNHEGAVTCETLAKMSEVISELEGRLSEAEVEEILDLMEEEGLPDRLTKQRDFRPQADKRK